MRFIIDGNGTISIIAARDLLIDIAKPYDSAEFLIAGEEVNYAQGLSNVLSALVDMKLRGHNFEFTKDTLVELNSESDVEKIFIVLGATTKQEEVKEALRLGIQVLDLERGLFPVTKLRELQL